MAKKTREELVRRILKAYGRTFAEELGIRIARNRPPELFQLLCAAMLFSARISADNATRAARALKEAGLVTPKKMRETTWQERVDVITWHGYKRYDESTSTMLGQTAEILGERYRDDLRGLREAAERDVQREKKLLQELKGIGPIGADIFLREVQVAWDEAYPYADQKVMEAARKLGLARSRQELARLVPKKDFPRLVAALVRINLRKAYGELQQ
jgi:endonuclease III